jgi:hypothetical protein
MNKPLMVLRSTAGDSEHFISYLSVRHWDIGNTFPFIALCDPVASGCCRRHMSSRPYFLRPPCCACVQCQCLQHPRHLALIYIVRNVASFVFNLARSVCFAVQIARYYNSRDVSNVANTQQ